MQTTIANANVYGNSTLQLTQCYCPADHSTMDASDERLEQLKALISKYDSTAAFARAFELNETYLRQLLGGHRSFGERAAKNMGIKIAGDPKLFFPGRKVDQLNKVKIIKPRSHPDILEVMRLMEQMDPIGKRDVLAYARSAHRDWESNRKHRSN